MGEAYASRQSVVDRDDHPRGFDPGAVVEGIATSGSS
jgi:hypothetical protein